MLSLEDAHDGDIAAAGGDKFRIELQRAARDAGVFAPHAPIEYGGHGLGMSDRAPVFEETGYSLFGPTALNIAAPDEGNVHMLAHVANTEQKQQYLAPLAHGAVARRRGVVAVARRGRRFGATVDLGVGKKCGVRAPGHRDRFAVGPAFYARWLGIRVVLDGRIHEVGRMAQR